ncbi:MAG: tryptophan-rich sensory protein [Candidatus Atribacteria bacterium]|nr:tryptophan-rich sensory protein [Candidatus Atribacteria bacterium]
MVFLRGQIENRGGYDTMRPYRIEQIQSIKDFRTQKGITEFQAWKLLISIAICQGMVLITGWFMAKSILTWYETLKKPSFTLPTLLVGLIYIILFALMGIALYLIWRKSAMNSNVIFTLAIFFAQLSLNGVWVFVFFGLKFPLGGVFTIIPLWVFILITSLKFFIIDRIAGYLIIPYLIWVSYISIINAFIVRLNS